MYDISVPVLSHFLGALSAVLKKAEAHCEARKITPEALLNDRVFPDMLPFTRQVQLVTDFAKGAGARLAGGEPPKYEDTEKTFAELQARIAKTVAFLGSLEKAAFAGADTRIITLKAGGSDMSFPGATFLSSFALPNFYFHYATAYNILRSNGVELGKMDFMGR